MVNRTRIDGGGYNKHDIITWYDQQAGWISSYTYYYITILRTNTNSITRTYRGGKYKHIDFVQEHL